MLTSLIILGLFLVMTVSGMLARYYSSVPLSELRRRARSGDAHASLLHEVARNAALANGVLWLISIVSFVILVVYIAQGEAFWLAVLWILVILLLYGLMLAKSRLIRRFAVMIAPNFALFIVAIRPYAMPVKKLFDKIVRPAQYSEIYEMDDLVELIKNQKQVTNNRIKKSEIDIALHALTFGGKFVKDYMTPRSEMRFVRSDEPVSTILMSELHDSGFSMFPVYMEDVDNIVGTLYLKDLVERRLSGKVFSAMIKDTVYVGEKDTLEEVLEIFLQNGNYLFVVRSPEDKVVGVITFENIVEQIIGRKFPAKTDYQEE